MDVKNDVFVYIYMLLKKTNVFFLEGFALIRARAGPIRAHMGPELPQKCIKNSLS